MFSNPKSCMKWRRQRAGWAKSAEHHKASPLKKNYQLIPLSPKSTIHPSPFKLTNFILSKHSVPVWFIPELLLPTLLINMLSNLKLLVNYMFNPQTVSSHIMNCLTQILTASTVEFTHSSGLFVSHFLLTHPLHGYLSKALFITQTVHNREYSPFYFAILAADLIMN